jgi:hypothetical protein
MANINTEVSINKSNSSSSKQTNIRQRSKEKSNQCIICGAPALYSNFGAITCSPCKMFFKRNAEIGQVS